MSGFLPVNKADMKKRGWNQCDFILITGDAYVDHPSFGAAVISRVLESRGFRVGIIAQPDWKIQDDFRALGKPRLGILITAGNMDSMVSRYTAAKKFRSEDAYAPGGVSGKRPDRASIVYANMIKQIYKKVPVILGGIEASLRRFAHYDYWSNKLRRSILLDSKADLIVYGMGEKPILEIADCLNSGTPASSITDVRGTIYKTGDISEITASRNLPSHEELKKSKRKFAESFMIKNKNNDPFSAKTLIECYGSQFVIQNPPPFPPSSIEMDKYYELPYERGAHPIYSLKGGVPALKEVLFSIISSRGCFGECSFCALTSHQGKIISGRTHLSIIKEAKQIIKQPGFKGFIHDIGGPTANFRHPACKKQETKGSCPDKSCLFPEPCKNLDTSHEDYLKLLRKVRALPGIKKVFIRSGIRFDYLMADKNDDFLNELCEHHVSGQLKIAPEHVSAKVLNMMGKPGNKIYGQFITKFKRTNKQIGKKQYTIPYFISSHPGSGLKEAIELSEFLRDERFIPDQVQDFYPAPGTLSTCMFYTELDPRTMKKIYVPKSYEEKQMQRALLQFRRPENQRLVEKALLKAGRADLIGYSKKSLIKPAKRGTSRK